MQRANPEKYDRISAAAHAWFADLETGLGIGGYNVTGITLEVDSRLVNGNLGSTSLSDIGGAVVERTASMSKAEEGIGGVGG